MDHRHDVLRHWHSHKAIAKNNFISIGQNLRYISGYRFLSIDMLHTLFEALPGYDFVQIS